MRANAEILEAGTAAAAGGGDEQHVRRSHFCTVGTPQQSMPAKEEKKVRNVAYRIID
jgi:hypothetical protein